jgi:hypothetical protein
MTRPGNADEPEDLISTARLLRLLNGEPDSAEADEDTADTASLPSITRMPEGSEVRECRIGRAVGHWVLQVRCDCGRRWFEVETVETATCPRCGTLVLIEIDER